MPEQPPKKGAYNPYLPEQNPLEYMKTKFMYDEYILHSLVPYIQSTRWSLEMKNKYITIVMEIFYPDMKLGNMSNEGIRQWVAGLKRSLLMARVGCDRDDTNTSEFNTMNDLILKHIHFAISRSVGPDRAAMLLIRSEAHERKSYYEESNIGGAKPSGGIVGTARNVVQGIFR